MRIVGSIRRVDEYDIKPFLAGISAQISLPVAGKDARTVIELCFLSIAYNERRCVSACVDDRGACRASAERLECKLTRASEKIEHTPALYIKLYHRKKRFLDLFRGRSRSRSLKCFEAHASCCARDYSHIMSAFRLLFSLLPAALCHFGTHIYI